jgi:quercetin dioxygenase-like cupin family protein
MTRLAVAAVVLTALASPRLPGDHPAGGTGGAMDLSVFPPSAIKWIDGPPSLPPGAKFAVLEGDPGKEGPFVMRVKVPDGYRIPPHVHPKPERVTVLAGTFHVGMGDRFDPSKGTAMPAGSYGTWPAGMKHYVWVTGETVVQLHGMGPWVIEYLNPADDPRKARK